MAGLFKIVSEMIRDLTDLYRIHPVKAALRIWGRG